MRNSDSRNLIFYFLKVIEQLMVIHDYFISLQSTKALNTGQVKAVNQKYKCILEKN